MTKNTTMHWLARFPTRNAGLLATLALASTAACGAEEDPIDHYNPPAEPSIFLPENFVVFDVSYEGETTSRNINGSNGGTQDLIFSSITLSDETGDFSLTLPASMTVGGLDSFAIPVDFAAPGRGVSVAEVAISSNATNFPEATVVLVGPVAENIGTAGNPESPQGPDLVYFEESTTVIAELGQAYVRFFNLGQRSLIITDISIEGDGFAFAEGVSIPTAQSPFSVGPNQLAGYTIDFTGSGAATGTFSLTSHDLADPEGTEETTTVEIVAAP